MANASNNNSNPFSRHTTRELYGHRKKLSSIAWSPNGKRLASGSSDTAIRIWLVEPHSQVPKPERAESELKGHGDFVTALQWKPSSADVLASIASTEKDKSVRFWDIRTSKCTNMLNMPASGSVSLAWSPDGNALAVANHKEESVTFIDTRKIKVTKTARLMTNPYQMIWGPTSSQLMMATNDGTVNIHSVQDMSLMWSLKGHMHSCYTFAVDRENEMLVSGGGDALVSVWELVNMTCVRTISRMDGQVKDLSLSRDGQYVAYASEVIPVDSGSATQRGLVEIVSIKTGEFCSSFTSKGPIDNVAWNPEFPVLAFTDEKEDIDSRGGRSTIGIVSIFAPPR